MSKLETKFVDDIAGKFFVPSYQRGYRWSKSEVVRLLEDVYNLLGGNGSGSNLMRDAKNYCLQPIVVKKKSDDEFELIDGQQRLTTLFLIYKHMNYQPNFSLDYETRPDSKNFLSNIDAALENDNIDFWFMSQAYESIKAWFDKKISDDSTNLRTVSRNLENLFAYNVKVIWYEVDAGENSAVLFLPLGFCLNDIDDKPLRVLDDVAVVVGMVEVGFVKEAHSVILKPLHNLACERGLLGRAVVVVGRVEFSEAFDSHAKGAGDGVRVVGDVEAHSVD